jgi:hypothetical protein
VSRVAALAAVLALSGCGSSTRTVTHVERCNGIAADLTIHYAICGSRFVRDGKTIPVAEPPGAQVGHWAKAYLSPDGKTFLAQWSAECEVPFAFFIPVAGGSPRFVTGGSDWTKAPPSIADGWTEDGRAVVELPRHACNGRTMRYGIYLISIDGKRKLLEPSRASR